MNMRQRIFAVHYAEWEDGPQAARVANYSESVVAKWKMLLTPEVKEFVAQLKAEVNTVTIETEIKRIHRRRSSVYEREDMSKHWDLATKLIIQLLAMQVDAGKGKRPGTQAAPDLSSLWDQDPYLEQDSQKKKEDPDDK